jgi:hypothetical protein
VSTGLSGLDCPEKQINREQIALRGRLPREVGAKNLKSLAFVRQHVGVDSPHKMFVLSAIGGNS